MTDARNDSMACLQISGKWEACLVSTDKQVLRFFLSGPTSPMRDRQSYPSFQIGCLNSLLCLLVLNTGTLALAETPPSPPRPTVFQPSETQHGFAEFDTPPDFFEDETPSPYDSYSNSPSLPAFDQKPAGLFHALAFAEDVEEDRTIRRGHIQVPINPTDTFPATSKAVYLVFSVHKHYAPYQIIGRLFSDTPDAAKPDEWLDEDIADLALEDESGYLKFFPPGGAWPPGRYRVDIYVGYIVNTVNKRGAMRFTVHAETSSPTESPEPVPEPVSPNP